MNRNATPAVVAKAAAKIRSEKRSASYLDRQMILVEPYLALMKKHNPEDFDYKLKIGRVLLCRRAADDGRCVCCIFRLEDESSQIGDR